MKRRDLERRLRIAGCYLKREGAAHSLWINPKNGFTLSDQAISLYYQGKDFKNACYSGLERFFQGQKHNSKESEIP